MASHARLTIKQAVNDRPYGSVGADEFTNGVPRSAPQGTPLRDAFSITVGAHSVRPSNAKSYGSYDSWANNVRPYGIDCTD